MTVKESIQQKLIEAAKEYSKLLSFDFVIRSKEFKYRAEYLLRFYKDNFLHLTGIDTKIKAADFFEKCLLGTIEEGDFDCESTEELKGKVREKLKNLLSIGDFFDKELIFEEMFEKNRVKCKLASSDGKCTLGFISVNKTVHVPLTLLNRNQIKEETCIKNCTVVKTVR